MKTEKIIIILVLILIYSCQKGKENSEINSDLNLNSKSNSENVIYRNITELEKYKGFEMLSGQVLHNSDKTLVYIQKDSLKVLILEKIIRNSSPKPNYSILDEVVYISKDSENFIALTQCDLIENPSDKIIFSLVENEEVEFFEKILKTWVIDLNENRFREIETSKVECLNEWYGYDG